MLCLLLDRPGELIPREEIERKLWSDTNVNFDHSLDVVVNRLIEPVTAVVEPPPRKGPRPWTHRLVPYIAVALLAAILAIVFARSRYDKVVSPQRPHSSASAPDR